MAGCRIIGLGIQSGSESLRRNYFKRDGSNEDIMKAVSLIRAKGIRLFVDILLGAPYETDDDI